MKYFQITFQEDSDAIIEYNGELYRRYLPIEINNSVKIKFKFIRSNSEFLQAIVVMFPRDFNGDVSINEKKVIVRKNAFPKIIFWEDNTSTVFEMKIQNFVGKICICNGADPIGNKTICKMMSEGCAMIVKETEHNILRCYCHDHTFDGPCDNLIFEAEIKQSEDDSNTHGTVSVKSE